MQSSYKLLQQQRCAFAALVVQRQRIGGGTRAVLGRPRLGQPTEVVGGQQSCSHNAWRCCGHALLGARQQSREHACNRQLNAASC